MRRSARPNSRELRRGEAACRPGPPRRATASAKGFGEISVELVAIEPSRLRDLVELMIQRHLPPDQFVTLKAAEDSERALIAGLVGMMLGGRP
jgi:hypothetical protein